MDYHARLAALFRHAPPLGTAAAGDERPVGFKDGQQGLQRTDIHEFVIMPGIIGQKDLPRDLAAHDPGKFVQNGVRVQRTPQTRGPAGVIDIFALEFAEIQDAWLELNRQVAEDSASLQTPQNMDQPGRVRRRDIQNLNGQNLARVRVLDEGDMLIRPLKDYRVRFSAAA